MHRSLISVILISMVNIGCLAFQFSKPVHTMNCQPYSYHLYVKNAIMGKGTGRTTMPSLTANLCTNQFVYRNRHYLQGQHTNEALASHWNQRRNAMTHTRLSAEETNREIVINPVQRLILLLTNLFPLWVAAGGALGYFRPSALSWMTGERITAALAVTMLCMGMTLELADFKRVLQNPRQVLDDPNRRAMIRIRIGTVKSRSADHER